MIIHANVAAAPSSIRAAEARATANATTTLVETIVRLKKTGEATYLEGDLRTPFWVAWLSDGPSVLNLIAPAKHGLQSFLPPTSCKEPGPGRSGTRTPLDTRTP